MNNLAFRAKYVSKYYGAILWETKIYVFLS